MKTGYYFLKTPAGQFPESSGYGVTIMPGFGQWILIHPVRGKPPTNAVSVEDIVTFLESKL